jgi:hypothetical protein
MNWRQVDVPTAADTRSRAAQLSAGGTRRGAALLAAADEAYDAAAAREELFLVQEHGAGPVDPTVAAWLAARDR